MPLTLGQLLQTLGRTAYQRGLDYADDGKVLSVTDGEDLIEGRVRGSGGRTYEQSIRWRITRTKAFHLEGECTCPVGYNCKHVGAVLIQYVRSGMGRDGQATELDGMPASTQQLRLPAPLAAWLNSVERAAGHVTESAQPVSSSGTVHRLVFALTPFLMGTQTRVGLTACKARLRRGGEIAATETIWDLSRLLYNPPSYMSEEDGVALRMFSAMRGLYGYGSHTEPTGRLGTQLLRLLLDDGRLYWAGSNQELAKGSALLLQAGAPRPARLIWQEEKRGMRLSWQVQNPGDENSYLLDTEPPLYVDGRECGEIVMNVAGRISLARLRELVRRAPTVEAGSGEAVSRMLVTQGLDEIIPPPQTLQESLREDVRMQAVLSLGAVLLADGEWTDVAQVAFDYDGQRCHGHVKFLVRQTAQGIERIVRDRTAEKEARAHLAQLGFVPLDATPDTFASRPAAMPDVLILPDQEAWLRCAREHLPQLASQGWRIEKLPGYRYDLAEVEDWYAAVEEQGDKRWFDLELGIVVGGERIPLLPVLIASIRRAPREFDLQALARRADNDELVVTLQNGMRVSLAWGRLKPILQILGELYFAEKPGNALRLPLLDAARLAELRDAAQLRWLGGERMRVLGEKMRSFGGVQVVAPPAGLCTQLRPYQAEGLAWLQFLREYNLAGILADDMGLGKTVQTLAHLMMEKEAGRLDKPALVIAPTSLMGNWQDEAARFAPGLRVLVLHGRERLEHFGSIPTADLVLTTYALLPRDEARLREHAYHLVILDEAHYIKNARSKAAQIVGLLPARLRLCLTGTPLENHLGELWSQFQFLLPGLLGDEKSFSRDFRTPIEKHGDDERRKLLMRRLKPFILRRTKDKVARELPPKTEMVRNVEIAGAQRDLYETVRLAMDKKVRDEIARKGMARSSIVILEALLKLRQVCCDPRLVKARGVKATSASSAKLVELLDMLDALLAEGRRILLFSQFTSMLALIEPELKARRIPYALLTGDTQDRAGTVRAFQQGDVPLFLISLKAGGVGLNLTAADTVIHYDPWWNPAVENQATDRAWRIGQDKPVFVYKLIAKGTLEEKIQALQQRKSELAQAILGGGETTKLKITQEDLQAIFAPVSM